MWLYQLVLVLLFENIVSKELPEYARAMNRPLNIAHRGLSSILPQNTMEAFEAALYQGADFIELDVVLTKDKKVLVIHDPYLSRITNIHQFGRQYEQRKETRLYNGEQREDWWVDLFTLEEMKQFKIKQMQAPNRLSIFDFRFTLSTLDEVIENVIKFNSLYQGRRNPDGRLGGILIEAKDSQMYRDLYDVELGELILNTLKKHGVHEVNGATELCPIYLQSFDFQTVKYWKSSTNLPRNYLVEGKTPINLTEIRQYAHGIGFQDKLIWNYESNTPHPLLQQTKDQHLLVHVWTFKDDVLLFNAPSAVDMYIIAQQQLELDGIITQFADVLTPVSQLLRNHNLEIQKEMLWHHTDQVEQIPNLRGNA